MCNCNKEIEQKTEALILEQKKDILHVDYTMLNRTIGGDISKVGIVCTYSGIKKLINGKQKRFDSTISIIATYCPFCGVKYD